MLIYVILHDISGSFLVVESVPDDRKSPLLPSVPDSFMDVDCLARGIFVLVTARYKRCSPEAPLAVRRQACEEDIMTLGIVVELLCRRCAMVLKSDYT